MKTWGSTGDIQKLKASTRDLEEFEQEFDENSMDEQDIADRYNLLERYGLKEMDEEDIDGLLGSYDKDSLDNKELENMERDLSKRIYQAIMSLSSVKKVAVEVYIDNSDELCGIVNIIVEYEPKGFLDRILGTSNVAMDAKTIEVTEIEISEIFINHPEVVENFEIRIESF